MNLVILRGNLTKDPDLRDVKASGRDTKVVSFSVAVNEFFKKSDGTTAKDVTYIDCEAWDSGAETIGKLLHKGDPVLIQGRIKNETWEKDGQKRSRTKIRVSSFEKLHRSSYVATDETQNDAGPPPEPPVPTTTSPAEEPNEGDSEIPF